MPAGAERRVHPDPFRHCDGGHASVAYAGLGVRLSQNLLKRGVVSGRLKQRELSDSAVEDMVGEVSGRETWTASIVGLLPKPPRCSQEKTFDPFSFRHQ